MKCNFVSDLQKAEKVSEFLRKNGDQLPDEAIIRSVSGENLDNWSLECDENNKVVSGVTYDNNDWYLCTFHYLATDPKERRKGLATKVMGEAVQKAKANPNCHVLASDITFDNEASKSTVKKFGFKEIDRFCWGKGEKPADILHYILTPPEGSQCKI